jgi:hypothetical protein
MMTEEELRQWRDVEMNKLEQTVNPLVRKEISAVLYVINTVLNEDMKG